MRGPFAATLGTKWRTLVLNGYELVQGVFRISDFKLNFVKKRDFDRRFACFGRDGPR